MNRNLKLIALSVMISGSFVFAQQTDEMGNEFDKTGPDTKTVAPSGSASTPTAGTVAGPGSAATMSAPGAASMSPPAEMATAKSSSAAAPKKRGFFARLFGGKAEKVDGKDPE